MARYSSSSATLLCRRTLQISNSDLKNVISESEEAPMNSSVSSVCQNGDARSGTNQNCLHFSEMAKTVSTILKTTVRWEETLRSKFESFSFRDARFFFELMKHLNNVLLSFKFYRWLHLNYNFTPDQVSCELLFDSLLDCKAFHEAKCFLKVSGFTPSLNSLEHYAKCLANGRFIQEAIDVLGKLKEMGTSASISTWNATLSSCLRIKRTDLIWKLYGEMIECGVLVNADAMTVEYLIRAFCLDGKFWEGYWLLRQVVFDGLVPRNIAFNRLIRGFCEKRDLERVSEIFHLMIAKNCALDVYTYQEVIKGLCKAKMQPEAIRVFNDLKDKGYRLDRVMYTTLIHGLCEIGMLSSAKKLWFEMIEKGIVPNIYTYTTMIHGCFVVGDVEAARRTYKEMQDNGCHETTAVQNAMISGLSLRGRLEDACSIFNEMPLRGISRDVISYNSLIRGFCKERRIAEAKKLLKDLVDNGLNPSSSSFGPLVEMLCEMGDVSEAKKLWSDMLNRGLKPFPVTYDCFISGLCNEESVTEALEWLIVMLDNKLKPNKTTFDRLILSLSENDRVDDTFFVLKSMFSFGYLLEQHTCFNVVWKLCPCNLIFLESYICQILETC